MEKQMDFAKIEKNERIRRRIGKALTYTGVTVWGADRALSFLLDGQRPSKSRKLYAEHVPALFLTLSPTLENYVSAFTAVPRKVSAQYAEFTVVTTALMVAASTPPCLHAFARLEEPVFMLFLSMMMDSGVLVVITNFATVTSWIKKQLYGADPALGHVGFLYLPVKENFEQVPDELYRAAESDRTSDLKYLFKVMIRSAGRRL